MTTEVDLIIHSANQLCVIPGFNGPQRGESLGTLGLITNGATAIREGKIVATGESSNILAEFEAPESIDASGSCLIPGFVDPHTHIPWAGDRSNEFEQRLAGATYMEIMAAGGGIMSTVRDTRAATIAELVQSNLPRLESMLRHGTTSAEAKSGYGLQLDTELKQLEAISRLDEMQPIELTATFLPGHAVPAEYGDDPEGYVNLIVDEMLPAGASWMAERGVVLHCDVFCEDGAFDLAQSRRILEKARDLGYRLKVHADEFVALGGTRLAVELGAVSADHLVKSSPEDIEALGKGNTVAVALPGTPFGLAESEYTPARAILSAGGALALASDCNPGTTWGESMQMVIALACRYMGLTPAQALAAATINGAHAIGRGHEVGSIEPGKQADLVLLNVADYRFLGYRYGTNLVKSVFKLGRSVV